MMIVLEDDKIWSFCEDGEFLLKNRGYGDCYFRIEALFLPRLAETV